MEQIEGRHPVLEAMKANRPMEVIYLLKDGKGEAFASIEYTAKEKKIAVRPNGTAKSKPIWGDD